MTAGEVGSGRVWLAAVPMDSGGSGAPFSIAVFRAEGKTARYVESVTLGDHMGALVYGGILHVTIPARGAAYGADCCYSHVRVLDYTFHNGRLKTSPQDWQFLASTIGSIGRNGI